VQSLQKNFPDFKQDESIKIGCFGKATAKALEDAGFRIDLEAPSEKAPSMTGCLDLYLEEANA
ncbi:MAG: uroporphyrinogen-III synthase, partial [Bacteroidaceae bacterium]|nr:uroporphyrinogen-III synthase [Bacteroidaceae bacterium]